MIQSCFNKSGAGGCFNKHYTLNTLQYLVLTFNELLAILVIVRKSKNEQRYHHRIDEILYHGLRLSALRWIF